MSYSASEKFKNIRLSNAEPWVKSHEGSSSYITQFYEKCAKTISMMELLGGMDR